MIAEGTYRDNRGRKKLGEIVFWGEWEPPSRVVRRWPSEDALPLYLHNPYFEPPRFRGFRQNTDPWVFGDAFRYSNCKQRTNKGTIATAMQRLTKGSLILFGSRVGVDFVLDTVFVIGRRVGSFMVGAPDDLEVDPVFRIATLESLHSGLGCGRNEKPGCGNTVEPAATFTLYGGATPDQPINGMFSFVPCLPYDGDGPRFARPAIELPGVVNSNSTQSARGRTAYAPDSKS